MPAKDLHDLIDWLKANPDKASAGIATVGYHLVTALFQKQTGTKFTLVPYRGVRTALQDLVAGRIDLLFGSPDLLPVVRGGIIKAYAATSDTRFAQAPDIPTFAEMGVPAVFWSSWMGLFAPRGNERLIVCRNPLLADERSRKRRELLDATEQDLREILARVRRAKRPLRGKEKIGLALGAVINHYKVGKHFDVKITDADLTFERKTEQINAEGLLDGIYVLRTDVKPAILDAAGTVRAYKNLATVERAFRSIKTVDLEVRPIHHRRAQRVRAHVLLCMLAYYLEWHMRQVLKPILFDDHDSAAAEAARTSIVAKAERSTAGERKVATKRTDDGLPIHSFRSLIADLATVTRNTMTISKVEDATFVLYPKLTATQQRAFEILAVPMNCCQ